MGGIIPQLRFHTRVLKHDNNQTMGWYLINYSVDQTLHYQLKFHKYVVLRLSWLKKTLVLNLWYEPTQHQITSNVI